MNWPAYYRLARFDKPTGIFLLFSPTAWALWIAQQGNPSKKWVVLFLVGTVLMRAAGCIINDIVDRNIDNKVKRTRHRPITSGNITLFKALIFLSILLLAALLIFMQLPDISIYYAIFALVITLIYPFCKRFISAPQAVLGLAFSMGIPMAYALNATLNSSMFFLLSINLLWTIAYDTQYALADKADDIKIGVKSTAILFKARVRLIIVLFQCLAQILWLLLGYAYDFSSFFYIFWILSCFIFIYQYSLLSQQDEKNCLQAFSSNIWYGITLWIAVILAYR